MVKEKKEEKVFYGSNKSNDLLQLTDSSCKEVTDSNFAPAESDYEPGTCNSATPIAPPLQSSYTHCNPVTPLQPANRQ